MTKFHVPRGADLGVSYTFPSGTDLSGYTAVFNVYDGLGVPCS